MTIKDLAKLTGYSVGTISRVMNDQPNVSPKTRQTVLEAVKRYGFQLNATAKVLKQQHSNSVLVVVKGMSSELLAGLVRHISTLFADTSYQLDVDFIDEDDNEVLRAVRLCTEKKPRGVLFLGGNPGNFTECFRDVNVPCVLVTNSARELGVENLSSVTTDDRHAAEAAVEALLNLGHRKIAIIGGDRAVSDISRRRWEGCRDALLRAEVGYDDDRDYCSARYEFEGGYQAARRLLETKPDMTAVFAMSDVMAVGAIRALRDQGRRVPEDVSVMGFDGVAMGEYLTPKLATITQNLPELAARSVELLCQAMERQTPACHLTVPFAVNCKESAQPLAGEENKECERL